MPRALLLGMSTGWLVRTNFVTISAASGYQIEVGGVTIAVDRRAYHRWRQRRFSDKRRREEEAHVRVLLVVQSSSTLNGVWRLVGARPASPGDRALRAMRKRAGPQVRRRRPTRWRSKLRRTARSRWVKRYRG